jgi:RNA polymerase sigma-70 factor, ECF subfamily
MQENQYSSVLSECSLVELTNTPIKVEASRTERFKGMMLKYTDTIYRFALYMTGNDYDAQDLFQKICVVAYKNFNGLEDETNYRAWLLKISVDTLTNFVPTYEVSEKNLEDDVDRAIYSLPVRYRMIIILADVENFTYKEISYIISCPVITVASELYEGRQTLKQKLHIFFNQHSCQEIQSCEKEVSCFGQ